MTRDSQEITLSAKSLAPFLEGFYERVARRARVDAPLVVQVALGRCKSKAIEDALSGELEAISSRIKEEREAA
jgi:hypothetical protein